MKLFKKYFLTYKSASSSDESDFDVKCKIKAAASTATLADFTTLTFIESVGWLG